MRCEKARRLASDAQDGELTPRRLARLEAHLEKCASCRAYRRSLELIGAEAARDAPFAPGREYWGDFVAGLSRKIDALDARRGHGPATAAFRPRLRPALVVGLVALVAFGAFLLLKKRGPAEEEFAYLHPEESLSGVLETAAGDPELGAYLDLEVRSQIASTLSAEAAGEAFMALDEPLFWESLSEEDLAAIAADLAKDDGQGGPG